MTLHIAVTHDDCDCIDLGVMNGRSVTIWVIGSMNWTLGICHPAITHPTVVPMAKKTMTPIMTHTMHTSMNSMPMVMTFNIIIVLYIKVLVTILYSNQI